MSDVNVIITAVDKGMDIIDSYKREVEDLRAQAVFDIHSIIAAVEREKSFVEQELDDLRYSSYEDSEDGPSDEEERLSRQCEMFERLLYQSSLRGNELESEWRTICGRAVVLAEDSKRDMAIYIRKLNRINIGGEYSVCSGGGHGPEYYVVIVDSQKYPQTAEHIKRAQLMGFPEYVTLGRADAAERRKASLADVKASPIYDRDEWPMAVFEEGGQGADVAYVDGRDNRGAGSSIGWQMRNFPDGSIVRVRVI